MPRMANTLSVAAGATSANVLAGLLDEFCASDSAVRVMAASAAVGINCTVVFGRTALVNDQLVSFANRFPVIPDDTVVEHGAKRNTRLIVTFRNTTGAAIVVNWVVDVTPLRR